MYKEKVETILLINNYLIYCKTKNPHSLNSIMVQKYLTQKIEETLKRDRTLNPISESMISFLIS